MPNAIDIRDIAHALSFKCRFGGHLPYFYSVAQHCVVMSYLVPKEYALYALLHDSMEAYLEDIPTPIKRLLPDYMALEKKLQTYIMAHFKLPVEMPSKVKEADTKMLLTEKRDIMKPELLWQDNKLWGAEGKEAYTNITLKAWTSKEAKRRFLRRIREINGTYIPTPKDKRNQFWIKIWGKIRGWTPEMILINS